VSPFAIVVQPTIFLGRVTGAVLRRFDRCLLFRRIFIGWDFRFDRLLLRIRRCGAISGSSVMSCLFILEIQ
jgi:hypothetical protein